jgi:hypothetical protein
VNALVLANFPMAILVILAIVGIPLWMTFKRPEKTPDYAGARAYIGAKAGLRAVPAQTSARGQAARVTQPHRAAA